MGTRIVIHDAIADPNDPTHLITSGLTVFDSRLLADAKLEAAARAFSEFNNRILAGRIITAGAVTKTFPIDAESLTLLVANMNSADTTVVTIDGQVISSLTTTQFKALVTNLGAYYRALKNVLAAHRVSIKALADIASCDAYDATANWPANP